MRDACHAWSSMSENMPAVSPIVLFVSKIATIRNVRSSILKLSPTQKPY